MVTKKTRRAAIAATVLSAALVLAGCVSESPGSTSSDTSDPKEVTVLSGLTGDKGALFEESLKQFEALTGIKVTHIGISNMQSIITTRVQAGDPPDIAMFPQPGLVKDMAAQGQIKPLDDVIDLAAAKEGMIPGVLDTTTVDGKLYAVPFDLSLKSLVWYPPKAFAAAGYQVPTTMEEFTALMDTMKADGNTPLCLSVESGTGSGWPATDWVEDLVLRQAGPDAYDNWISHDLTFESPEITKAFETFGDLAFPDGNVLGGRQGIVATKWSDGIIPMFNADKPGCWMFKMGSFMANSMPEGVNVGEDVSAFYFPSYARGGYDGNPVEGGGDLAALFTDNPSAAKLIAWMSSPEAGIPWAKGGGFLSPWTSFDPSNYPNDLTRTEAAIMNDASTFRFDASDAMPAAVGTGSFFQQSVAWINGDTDLPTALKNIDASWPK